MDPIKALNSTVLPAPLGPIIASDVPRGTPKLRSRITSVVPNRTVRCSTSNALVIPQPYQSAACGGITHSNPGLSVLVSGHNRRTNYNRLQSDDVRLPRKGAATMRFHAFVLAAILAASIAIAHAASPQSPQSPDKSRIVPQSPMDPLSSEELSTAVT